MKTKLLPLGLSLAMTASLLAGCGYRYTGFRYHDEVRKYIQLHFFHKAGTACRG